VLDDTDGKTGKEGNFARVDQKATRSNGRELQKERSQEFGGRNRGEDRDLRFQRRGRSSGRGVEATLS